RELRSRKDSRPYNGHRTTCDSHLAGLGHRIYPALWTLRLLVIATRSQSKTGTGSGSRVMELPAPDPQVDRQGQPYYIRRNAAHRAWSRVAGACIVGLTLAVNLERGGATLLIPRSSPKRGSLERGGAKLQLPYVRIVDASVPPN